MPAELDNLRSKIWSGLKGKINPRNKKPYTERDAWAIATSQFKKSRKLSSVSLDEYETEEIEDLVTDAVKELEEQ